MPALKSMSIKQLEAYRAEQKKAIRIARTEYRKAGEILHKKLQEPDIAALKAQRDALDAQLAEMEGADG